MKCVSELEILWQNGLFFQKPFQQPAWCLLSSQLEAEMQSKHFPARNGRWMEFSRLVVVAKA